MNQFNKYEQLLESQNKESSDMMRNSLAIHGGIPVRKEFLPFHRPFLGREEEEALIKTLRSGWITTGPRTREFEQKFREFIGCRHAIGLNSCTAGLHLGLVVSGVGPGHEVITTPMTFASTANIIIHCGAKPVFVDVEPNTLNIDPQKIEAKITKKTKAIIPVHFAGNACRIDKISEIARSRGLAVVEDAAHALETKYGGKRIGTYGNIACFSFYATKNITTAEGGMLTTDDDDLAEKTRVLSLHGISKDAWKRYGLEGYRHWDIVYPGYKYNMFDLQASLGIEQLKRVNGFLEKRALLVRIYDEAFQEIPEIKRIERNNGAESAFHLYVVQFRIEVMTADRDTIMNAVQAENIGIGIHFRAIHLHPYYRETFGFERGMYPHAEYASDRVISLPLCPSMSEKDALEVIEAVRKVIRYFRP